MNVLHLKHFSCFCFHFIENEKKSFNSCKANNVKEHKRPQCMDEIYQNIFYHFSFHGSSRRTLNNILHKFAFFSSTNSVCSTLIFDDPIATFHTRIAFQSKFLWSFLSFLGIAKAKFILVHVDNFRIDYHILF